MNPALFRFVSAALTLLMLDVSAGTGMGLGDRGTSIAGLRLIGVQTLPYRERFAGTVVGGLSGLDYDPLSNRWLAISDDRAEFGPARGYTLRLDYDLTGFSLVRVETVVSFRQPGGSAYPAKGAPGTVPDFEAVRYDPMDGSLWYASEGDRALGLNPFVRHADCDGNFIAELPVPSLFEFNPNQKMGPRNNLTFEGLAFARNGQSLWLAMEAPLYQDGPTPTLSAGALVRITRLGREGRVFAQYAYPLEPVPNAAARGKLESNGVAEILALTDDRLLVLERAGRQDETGRWHFAIRLFEAGFADATEVQTVPALARMKVQPATKRLVLDFAMPGLYPADNLEGITWGRKLANGHDTLVLVSDDNFNANQSTQLWAFEVLPSEP